MNTEIQRAINDLFNNDFMNNNVNTWKETLKKISFVPFCYTVSSINYYTSWMSDKYEEIIDLSCFLRLNNDIIGLWTIQLRRNLNVWQLGSNYSSIINPIFVSGISEKTKKKIMDECINKIKKICQLLCISSIEFHTQSYTDGASLWHKKVMNLGASIVSVNHLAYVDLKLSLEELLNKFRKRYKEYVISSKKIWEVVCVDTYDEKMFEIYCNIHHIVAGKVTRGKETWNAQLNALKEGEGFLIFLFDSSQEIIGAAFFFCSKDECYYHSGAYFRELFHLPVSHILQYSAIEYCKNKKMKYYSLGERFYTGDTFSPTDKELSIANFKEGFSTNLFFEFKLKYEL